MMKKLLALLLALVFCFALLAGCGGNTDDTTAAPTGTTAPEGTVDATESAYTTPDLTGVKITQYMANNKDYDPADSYVHEVIEKTLNLDLEIIELDEFDSNVKTMLAEKKPPELQYVTNYTHNTWAGYALDGAYINILDYIDKMPNVKAYIEDPANADNVQKFTYSETEMYAIPYGVTGNVSAYAFLYRKDVFEKNNIELPTSQEEFVAVLQKLKELYPSSMPFIMRNMTKNIQGGQAMAHLFGTAHVLKGNFGTYFTLDAEGNYEMAQTSLAYKEMAQFFKDLTDKGLMHTSSMTVDPAGWTEAIASDMSFISYDKIDRIPGITTAGQGLNPEFQMSAFAPFNFGTHATKTDVVSTSFAGETTTKGFMIGQTDNIDDVVTYIDWLYSEEGIQMTNWGIEGESYEVKEDGSLSFIDSFLEEKGGRVICGFGCPGVAGHALFEPILDTLDEEVVKGLLMAQEYCGKTPKQEALSYNEDEQFVWDTYGEALYNAAQGEWSKYALGQKDFADWDSFLQMLKDDYHYDDVKAIHESALARLQGE